jgi:hypothetical protein
MIDRPLPFCVIAGRQSAPRGSTPPIHVFKSWTPGTSPGMTLFFDQEA